MNAAGPGACLQSLAGLITKGFGSPGFCGWLCRSHGNSALPHMDQRQGQTWAEGLKLPPGTPGNLVAWLFASPRWWWERAGACLGRPQLGGFPPLAVHTPFNPVSPISFILKGQRAACLSLLIRAGFRLCGPALTFSGLAFWNITPN